MKKRFYFLCCFMCQVLCFGKNNLVSLISGQGDAKKISHQAKHNNLVSLLQKASESDNSEYQKAVQILSNVGLKEAYEFNIESIRLLFLTLSEQVLSQDQVDQTKKSFSLVSILNLAQPPVQGSVQKPTYNLSSLLQVVQQHMPTKHSFSLISLVQSTAPANPDQVKSKANLISLLQPGISEKTSMVEKSNNLVSLLPQG